MKKLFLYTTKGCHLCELAKEQIYPLLENFTLQMVEVDIADDEALLEKYGVRIPVIKLDMIEEDLGWPFDSQDVRQFLLRR